jgi:hypothetical protein
MRHPVTTNYYIYDASLPVLCSHHLCAIDPGLLIVTINVFVLARAKDYG